MHLMRFRRGIALFRASAWRKFGLRTSGQQTLRLTKGARTREKILQAAENTFAKVGYERATLREVARVAGIRQPGLYNYVKTKRELYEAVLKRMMNPLIAVLNEVAALPAGEWRKPETKLVDLLVANRNIPNLLVRAFLSTNQMERNIAVNWIKRVRESSPRRKSTKPSHVINDTLIHMAILNAWLGYFWTAPIIETLTGKSITDAKLVKAQKDLLVFMADTLPTPR
jgi:AcrR family transcriptional regulator